MNDVEMLYEITEDGVIFDVPDVLTDEEWEADRWGSQLPYDLGMALYVLFGNCDQSTMDNGDGTYTHEFRFSVIDDPREGCE